jgi:hypothetical protein
MSHFRRGARRYLPMVPYRRARLELTGAPTGPDPPPDAIPAKKKARSASWKARDPARRVGMTGFEPATP